MEDDLSGDIHRIASEGLFQLIRLKKADVSAIIIITLFVERAYMKQQKELRCFEGFSELVKFV